MIQANVLTEMNCKSIFLSVLFFLFSFRQFFADSLIVTNTDPAYERAIEVFNTTESILSKKPTHIIFCYTLEDVITAIRSTREKNIEISIRSGGHSYEGLCLCNGVVLDLSYMNNIEISEDKKRVKVQSGCQMMDIYSTLWKEKCTIVGGSCGTVGIGGFTLGGGFGFLSRKYGLAIDNLLEFELVDASGNDLIVNPNSHPDLFWACRGAGSGNFGVITSFTFAMHPIDNVVVYKISWSWDQFFDVITAWQHWSFKAPDALTSVLVIPLRSRGNIFSKGIFLGKESEFISYLNKLAPHSSPSNIEVETMNWLEAARQFDLSSSQEKRPFKAKSDYVENILSKEALRTILQNMSIDHPKLSCGVIILDSYGGAINRISDKATAFIHREKTKFSIQYLTYWNQSDPKEAEISQEWISNFYQRMRPYVSGFAYQNYCDLDLPNWMEAYYGKNQERLREIKKKYDPNGFFTSLQGIPIRTDRKTSLRICPE